ncbi:MAG: hypothetical protein DDT42_01853 [candidate division WS2 bacterium]|uniref:Uncharacterized protein n=1 Tax=Psychracetigena formicireducens TaxID=2986056 RepID=A0A9E2BN13_PSYF1|nr:hypothetical protein [Candidatus Psychracetigena formicireducens]
MTTNTQYTDCAAHADYTNSNNAKYAILKLREWGWTDQQIADQANVHRTTIGRIRLGSICNWVISYSLIRLFEDDELFRK